MRKPLKKSSRATTTVSDPGAPPAGRAAQRVKQFNAARGLETIVPEPPAPTSKKPAAKRATRRTSRSSRP